MAQLHLNVSQLKCACQSAEWLEKFLARENPSTQRFAPPGTPPVYGRLFHQTAHRWIELLCRTSEAAEWQTESAFWAAFFDTTGAKALNELLERGNVDEAHRLSEVFRAFCRRLLELRERTTGFRDWSDLFLGSEFTLKNVALPMGSQLFVSGILDGLRLAPPDRIEVVDYKLTDGQDQPRDMIQMALYAALLRQTRPGIPYSGVLEYYLPHLHTVEIQPEELEAIYHDKIEPVLARLLGGTPPPLPKPVRPIAQPKPASQPQPKPIPNPKAKSAPPTIRPSERPDDEESQRIEAAFQSFKLPVRVLEKRVAPQLIRYLLKPGPGVKVASLVNRADDLQVALASSAPPFITAAKGHVTLDLPREQPGMVTWAEVMQNPVWGELQSAVAFPIGVGIDGELITADFADANTTHALVGGASGSGKSEFLRALVASLVARRPPSQLQLALVDPKLLTFHDLEELPHLQGPIVHDTEAAIALLESAVEEMERRYAQLKEEGYANLGRRFEDGRRDLPFRILIFDEFADLILTSKESRKTFETLVSRIAAKGRAAGLHLVLATQRPDREVVTGLIKANLPLKICLRVSSAVNSQIVLGQPGGETLLGKGDLFVDHGRGIRRAQAPFLLPKTLDALRGKWRK